MFDNFSQFLSTLLEGVPLTAGATVGGIVLATAVSFAAGLAMLSRFRVLRFVLRAYVEVWRGTSEVVQLFWIYFALPLLTGFQIMPFWAAIIVLGLNHGAYGAEIVRGAVQSVPKSQHEGCVALGLGPAQRMRRVILPQALVDMVPPFNNLYIQLLKASSLLTLITVPELTYQARQVLVPSHTGQVLGIWTLVLVLYLLMSLVISAGMKLLERGAAAKVGRTPPKREDVVGAGGHVTSTAAKGGGA